MSAETLLSLFCLPLNFRMSTGTWLASNVSTALVILLTLEERLWVIKNELFNWSPLYLLWPILLWLCFFSSRILGQHLWGQGPKHNENFHQLIYATRFALMFRRFRKALRHKLYPNSSYWNLPSWPGARNKKPPTTLKFDLWSWPFRLWV